MARENVNESSLLEKKQSLLNQLHPTRVNSLCKSSYEKFRKNKLAEVLKIEKTLARLKGYYQKFDQ